MTDKQAQNQRTVAKFKQAMKEMRQAIQDRIAAGEAKVEEMEGQVSKESESNRKDMETINDEMAAWWTSKLQVGGITSIMYLSRALLLRFFFVLLLPLLAVPECSSLPLRVHEFFVQSFVCD